MTKAGKKRIAQLSHGAVAYWTYHDPKLPTVFVLHGFRGTHHGLEDIASGLKNYHVVIPDLPGFGASAPFETKSHTIETYAESMSELIASLQLEGKCILLGHSMGTVIAAHILAQHPRIASKAIFINPVSEQPPFLRLLPGYLYHRLAGKYLPARIGETILRNKHLFLLGSSVMTKTRDRKLRKVIHWNHITYMKQFANRKALLEAFESSNKHSLSQYTKHITIPVLMIVGRDDAIAPLKGQRRVADQLPLVKLVEISDVGHIIHYEKAAEAAEEINLFLR